MQKPSIHKLFNSCLICLQLTLRAAATTASQTLFREMYSFSFFTFLLDLYSLFKTFSWGVFGCMCWIIFLHENRVFLEWYRLISVPPFECVFQKLVANGILAASCLIFLNSWAVDLRFLQLCGLFLFLFGKFGNFRTLASVFSLQRCHICTMTKAFYFIILSTPYKPWHHHKLYFL